MKRHDENLGIKTKTNGWLIWDDSSHTTLHLFSRVVWFGSQLVWYTFSDQLFILYSLMILSTVQWDSEDAYTWQVIYVEDTIHTIGLI